MRDGRDHAPVLRQNRAAQRRAGQVFLHDGGGVGQREKAGVRLFQSLRRARDDIALRGGQPERFAAQGLDHARQRRAGGKMRHALAKLRRKAPRHGDAQPLRKLRERRLVVQQRELTGVGDAKTAHSVKRLARTGYGGERPCAHRQQRGFFTAARGHVAAQRQKPVCHVALRQLIALPRRAAGKADGFIESRLLAGDDLHARVRQIADQRDRHPIMRVRDNGDHEKYLQLSELSLVNGFPLGGKLSAKPTDEGLGSYF